MKLASFILALFTSSLAFSQSGIPVMNFGDLEPRLNQDDGNTWVVNFWATWCAPCVKEMPYFEKLRENYKDKNVKVLLVSLDFANQLERRVIPFVSEHNIRSEVILLNDPRANNWIPKVSEEWSGALPATLIYNKHHRRFYEQSFTFDELETVLKLALSDIK